METSTHGALRRGIRSAIVAVVTSVALFGCDTGQLLEAPDPDLVNPGDVGNPAGAEAMRVGAMARWRDATAGDNGNGDENTWLLGGLLADEWATSSTFVQNDELDIRNIRTDNSSVTQGFRDLQRVRTAVAQALPLMRQFRATETSKIAELFLAQAQAEMQLASDFCGAIPLSNGVTSPPEWGDPLDTDSVFKVAVASYDSGLAVVTGTSAEAVRVNRALRIGKARSLLALRRYTEAAALVADIPTDFRYQHTFSSSSGDNAIWGQATSGRRYNVGDNREGNARDIVVANNLNFFSANDPRVPASYSVTIGSTGRPDTTRSQDGNTLSRTTTIWEQETPVDVFNGTDARLIQAEAAYQAGDFAGMMTILNALRASPTANGEVQADPLPALSDPGTTDGRIDLLFREKAFWTYGRGQRLGDLRRLIRDYGRTAANTYPTGAHYRTGTYGTDLSMPVPQEEENNPNYQRSACNTTQA